MKNIYLILSVFAIVFTACETDFDVNAEWEELTVVYGLIDQSQSQQFIKINKAFIGEGNALEMATISDSVNFNPENIEVKLYKLNEGSFNVWDTVASISLHDTVLEKDTGLFSIDNNIVYTVKTNVLPGFFNVKSRYAILVKSKLSGKIVSANTEIIEGFNFLNFNTSYKFGFYNPNLADSSKYISKTLIWNEFDNGEIYQLDLRFNYLEAGQEKSLFWNQPLVSNQGGRDMQVRLEGDRFFNFLRLNINDDTMLREFIDLDIVMTVGTKDLNTYIEVNKPITGIVQERPQFSNIINGIGLFSARYTHIETGINLTDDTKDYLINELGRNFQ